MSEPDFRVLIIDDDEDDFVLARDVFAQISTLRFGISWQPNFDKALAELDTGSYDAALLDYRLETRTGLDFLEAAKKRHCKVPIILLTGQGDRDVDIAAMRAGAADYLQKSELRPDVLERALRYAISRARDQQAVAELNQRLLEEHAKLLRAERLSSIGLISAGIAHEINNPLCGVMALVKSLRDRQLPPDKVKEYLCTIQDGLERMRGTVTGLLDFARERPLSMTAVPVADAVEECLRLAGSALRQKQLVVQNDLRPDTMVTADRPRLLQVILNLLLNAVYAAPPGGRITLWASCDGMRTGITVADNGAGIPQSILERVCDPFFTTKPTGQGTGLGLAIASNIVKQHKGELSIKSRPGEGTAVTVWLPDRGSAAGDKFGEAIRC